MTTVQDEIQEFPIYTDVFITGQATQTLDSGLEVPLNGPMTVWYEKPDGTIISMSVTCTNGTYTFSLYGDTPGKWKWCARNSGSPHGGMFDQAFRVKSSFAPETP